MVSDMSFELTDDEGKFLVKLARRSVSTFLDEGEKIPVPSNTPVKLLQRCGVFVTLNTMRGTSKELRGCIGYPEPTFPLAEATINSAINSATEDPRFPPMSRQELEKVVVEVSVLTPPELMLVKSPKDYVKKVEIGKDGLIVERGVFKGLLLPQVPVEWGWDAEEFLAHCCMKAGLYPDAWLTEGTKLYKFHAIIFNEKTPDGTVERVKLS